MVCLLFRFSVRFDGFPYTCTGSPSDNRDARDATTITPTTITSSTTTTSDAPLLALESVLESGRKMLAVFQAEWHSMVRSRLPRVPLYTQASSTDLAIVSTMKMAKLPVSQ